MRRSPRGRRGRQVLPGRRRPMRQSEAARACARVKKEHRMDVKTLTIDGKLISARAGQTILDVAREAGVHIPTLCHLEGVREVAACRLCLVEVAGTSKLLPACVTEVAEGMDVRTNTE